jgi:CheY-like chemotaxis protein
LAIAITGYGQEEDRKRAEDAGFDHHIIKPFDLDQIQELIREFQSAGSADAR